MYRSVWNSFNESVCSLNYYSRKDIQFFRSSGFRYENYLIVDSCKEVIDRASYVLINFSSNDPCNINRSVCFTMREFRKRLINMGNGMDGVLILPIKFDELRSVPAVKYDCKSLSYIGTPIAILSYSRKISQLYLKTGMISSYLDIRGDKLILIESSFETGNSGSPLINAVTGKVIGVIIDCFPSPAQNHKKLKNIIEENIRILNDASGKTVVGEMDPAQVMSASQHMIKHLAKEIYLSANRNFGFALPVERISRHIKHMEHKSQFTTLDKTRIE